LRLSDPVEDFIQVLRGFDEQLYRIDSGEVLDVFDLEFAQPELDVGVDPDDRVERQFLAQL
jgi:hypothetical protein